MYLADTLRIIRDGLGPDDAMYQSAYSAHQRDFARRVLDGYDLYSYTASAISMAADLRIDTPDRLEGVLESVLRRKRKFFIEVNHDQRAKGLEELRGLGEKDLPPGRYNPERIGVAVDCEGDGRATVELAWVFPRKMAKQEYGSLLKDKMAEKKTRLEKEAVLESFRIGVSHGLMKVDINRNPEFTRAEFQERLDNNDPSVSVYKRSADQFAKSVQKRMGKRALDAQAWRDYRLNEVARFSVSELGKLAITDVAASSPQSLEEVLTSSQRDYDGEIFYLTALAAVLVAETDAIKTDVRQGSPRRRERAVSPRDLETDRLSVVSLNLSDKALTRVIRDEYEGKKSSSDGPSRSRHYVRGHLFRARNGKIVYRKPHWRGSLTAVSRKKLKLVR